MSLIYFDPDLLARGQSIKIDDPLVATDGRSYEVLEWIGRGGNGAVFRCRERSSGDEYAIKFLLTNGVRSALRFTRETNLLRQLEHDHLVRFRSAGRARSGQRRRGVPFVVMEIAECNLLNALQQSDNGIAVEQYLGQFRGLARGLASLHSVAVHRDIKPENILIAGERWLLGDYGLCRFSDRRDQDLTPEDQAVGPKFWMSPEASSRRLGRDVDISAASDVFQLAAVFWYVVTGKHPSGVLTLADWSGPERLFKPLFEALQHNPERRPANGAIFADRLESALNS